MARVGAIITAAILWLALLPAMAVAGPPRFTPGAPGVGDPYFPLAGNGGYDVAHYDLRVGYDPPTDRLTGVARIRARATKNLSRFNLDLDGLHVRSIRVDGRRATWTRRRGELRITPRHGLRKGHRFTTVIRYDGVPQTIGDSALGQSGFIHTDDGAVVAGEPDVAATWFPVNDHPSDKASYTFYITVPKGLEAVANGVLRHKRTRHGHTTWTWVAREPMASYLATATMGQFDLDAYRADGLRYWDAIDPTLLEPPAPRTGEQFAISQIADLSYKRLARTISVPDEGAQLSFWVTRDTEPNWDFMFVEAHTPGEDDWTTLPDTNDHTSQDTGFSCPFWLELHPLLTHYQTDNGDDTCAPKGTSGDWWAASGASDGYEQWTVDLSAFSGGDVEVAISYASDDTVQRHGLLVDDVEVSTGEGSTSFEDDGDTLDGWTVPGAPDGSEPNPNDWIAGTADDAPPPVGEVVQQSFARQPEILSFLSDHFGPYPFSAAGGIVDNVPLSFALENQTRPIYSPDFFGDEVSGADVLAHELTHQWYGDSLSVKRWKHIWLNEGFATYAEWLWSEHEGLGTPQEIFEGLAGIPADDPFWSVTIGDPGPDLLFDGAVYDRGAMTLQALRNEVGDTAFFRILRRWARAHAYGNVTTAQFIALAERISGQELDDLFDTWLFTPEKPAGIEPADAAADAPADGSAAAQALEQLGMSSAGTSGTTQRHHLQR